MLKCFIVLFVLSLLIASARRNVSISVLNYAEALEEAASSPEVLLELLNVSNTERLLNQSDSALCLLTRITPSVYSYAVYTYFVQSLYAAKHGYIMLPLFSDSAASDYSYHRKIQPIIEILSDYSHICAYVAWFDADLIPLDQTLDLQDKFLDNPDVDIMASRDVSTLINTGCLLVRNTAWAVDFLHTWLACRQQPDAHNEQLGFHCAYKQYMEDEVRKKIAIVAEHELNSIAPAMRSLLPQHAMLHLAAEDNAYRQRVFKTAAHSMMSELKQGDDIPSQLGISRVLLQELAIEVYEEIYLSSLAAIQSHVQFPVNASIDMDIIERFRMAVSKYCFAIEYHHTDHFVPINHAQLLLVRTNAYESLRSLLCLYIALVLAETHAERQVVFGMASAELVDLVIGWLPLSSQLSEHPVADRLVLASRQADGLSILWFQTLPEIAKLTVELGYECLLGYVGAVPDASGDAVSALVQELHAILALLRRLVHPALVSIVDKMIRELALLETSFLL
eukprot:gene27002-32623_t